MLTTMLLAATTAGAASSKVQSVPLCVGLTLSASYLADVPPGHGPGFRFTLINKTSHTIKLAEPVPSSSHWYARVRDHWMWRASNGAGGSLVNAENERGSVMVYPSAKSALAIVTIAPHQTRVWTQAPQENPVLEYKPGCALCSYPGESDYQVVFAYAYLPASADEAGLLTCGLRSAPAPMPPKRN
jgi:hypothetical protein